MNKKSILKYALVLEHAILERPTEFFWNFTLTAKNVLSWRTIKVTLISFLDSLTVVVYSSKIYRFKRNFNNSEKNN